MLLYSYLISEVAAPFWGSLAILTGVLFLGQMLRTFTLVFSLGIGWADFLRLALYLLPKLMMFSMPLASMLGVILGFNRLGADHEFLALRAAGVKLRQIIAPVLIYALAVMAMAGYSTTVLMPKGLVNMEVFLLKLAREKIDRGIREQSFSESLAGIVAYVDRIDPATGQWRDVFLYDGRRPERPLTVTARAATLTADYDNLLLGLRLTDGTIDYLDQELSRHIDFAAYALNLPVTISKTAPGKGAKPIEMSQSELLAAARAAGDTPKARAMLVEYHQRLTLAAGCLILTLMGLPLATRTRPGGRPIAIPIGLVLFLCYYLLFSFSETVAEQGGGAVALVLWTPNLVFALLTAGLILRMDKESLITLPLAVSKALERLPRLWPGRKEGR